MRPRSSNTTLGRASDVISTPHDATSLQLSPDAFHSALTRARVIEFAEGEVDRFRVELDRIEEMAEMAISTSQLAVQTTGSASEHVVSLSCHGKSILHLTEPHRTEFFNDSHPMQIRRS